MNAELLGSVPEMDHNGFVYWPVCTVPPPRMTLLNFCPPSFISSGRADGHSGANHSPQFIPFAVVNYCAKLFLLAFFYVDQIENIVPVDVYLSKKSIRGMEQAA